MPYSTSEGRIAARDDSVFGFKIREFLRVFSLCCCCGVGFWAVAASEDGPVVEVVEGVVVVVVVSCDDGRERAAHRTDRTEQDTEHRHSTGCGRSGTNAASGKGSGTCCGGDGG